MEGLIPLIIAVVLSFLFKNKKEPDKKTVEKPVNSTPVRKTVSENPLKELGDFAKQFTSERQQERKTKPPVVPDAPVVEKVERQAKRNQGVARTSGRLSTHQEPAQLRQKPTPIVSSLLPSNEDELIRAIIFSEILAPPKSKR